MPLKQPTKPNQNLTDEVLTLIRKDAHKHASRFKIEYDEAVSIAYLAITRANQIFDPTKNVPFLPFARQHVLWAHMDEKRKRNNFRKTSNHGFPVFRQLEDEDLTLDGISYFETRDFLSRIFKKLKQSRLKNKEVFAAYYVEQYTFNDIAKKLQIGPITVSRKIGRLQPHLKELKESYFQN